MFSSLPGGRGKDFHLRRSRPVWTHSWSLTCQLFLFFSEVREGSCFCDVPAALYSVFKNCYMNITDMHLLNVSAGIGTLNPMLFEPEKYTKHSQGVIQPELHIQHHRLYLKDCPTRLHKQWRDTCSHSLCSQHKPQKADWEWCAQLSHNTFSKTEKSSPSTIHTHTCTPTHTHRIQLFVVWVSRFQFRGVARTPEVRHCASVCLVATQTMTLHPVREFVCVKVLWNHADAFL